jgi:hypothetical protein
MLKPDGNIVYFNKDNESCVKDNWEEECHSISEDGSRMDFKHIKYIEPDYEEDMYYYVTTMSDIEYNFELNGRLTEITNLKTDQYLTIYYVDSTSLKIDYITDKAQNKIDFTYDTGNTRIKKIELSLRQPNGTDRIVEEKNYFFDTNNDLDRITRGYRYGTYSYYNMVYDSTLNYDFDSDNKLRLAYDDKNFYQIEYQYNANNKVNNVITSENSKLFGEIDISYLNNKTIYANHKSETIDYTFDNYGHTINIMDNYGNTTFYKYSGLFTNINGLDTLFFDPNYYNNHKLLESSDVIKQQQNPVVNHGFELVDDNFQPLKEGWTMHEGPEGFVGISTTESMLGSNSLFITKTTSSVVSSSQDIFLKNGNYTVEGWVKNSASTQGAYIDVIGADLKGTPNKVYNSNTWVKYKLTFTLNTSKNITLKLINESANSTAYFDNIQIVEGFVDTRYNSLLNNSFENGTTGWTLNNASIVDVNETGILEKILGE